MRLTRLTLSEGKRAEPRLMMAHPIGPSRKQRVAEAIAVFVIGFALAIIFLVAGR